MKVVLMGGPKHGQVIDMGKGFGDARWAPPIFRVPEYSKSGFIIRGPAPLSIVDYRFYRRISDDLLIYKRPGYVVGSL